MKLKDFDLQKALSGEYEVIARNGSKPEQMFYFDKATDRKLTLIFDGLFYFYDDNGKFLHIGDSPCDLFLLPKVVDRWINVYMPKGGLMFCGMAVYTSYEMALENKNSNYHSTIKIQIEL